MSYCHNLSAALSLNKKGKQNIKKIKEIINSEEFRYAIEKAEISGDNDTLELSNSWCNYHDEEIIASLIKLTNFIKLGEEVECRGEDDSHWRFLLTINGWLEQEGHIVYE